MKQMWMRGLPKDEEWVGIILDYPDQLEDNESFQEAVRLFFKNLDNISSIGDKE